MTVIQFILIILISFVGGIKADQSNILMQCLGRYIWFEEAGICMCHTPQERILTPYKSKRDCARKKTILKECDSSQNPCTPPLRCLNGACTCDQPGVRDDQRSICYSQEFCESQRRGEFYFHEGIGVCVLRIGSEVEESQINVKYACPNNSEVQHIENWRDNIIRCECNSAFTQSKDRKTCVVAKFRGEECSQDEDEGGRCDQDSKLVCVSEGPGNVCGCTSDGKWIWNPKISKCVIKTGGDCDWMDALNCTPGSMCIGRCVCKYDEGYAASSVDRFCYMRHGSSCQGLEDCLPEQTCMEGKCACPDPLIQKLNDEVYNGQQCLTQPGFPCSSSIGSPCSKNAECKSGICECMSGFRNLNGVCVEAWPHGSNCTSQTCDSSLGMACINGACACVSPTFKYVEGKGCVAGLGYPCGVVSTVGEGCGSPEQEPCAEYVIRCEERAECKPDSEEFQRNKSVQQRCAVLRKI